MDSGWEFRPGGSRVKGWIAEIQGRLEVGGETAGEGSEACALLSPCDPTRLAASGTAGDFQTRSLRSLRQWKSLRPLWGLSSAWSRSPGRMPRRAPYATLRPLSPHLAIGPAQVDLGAGLVPAPIASGDRARDHLGGTPGCVCRPWAAVTESAGFRGPGPGRRLPKRAIGRAGLGGGCGLWPTGWCCRWRERA